MPRPREPKRLPEVLSSEEVGAIFDAAPSPKYLPAFMLCYGAGLRADEVVSYFHVVFTLPASLRPFFAHEGRAQAMDALFAAVSESILETAATRAGLRPGVLAVLHTWNQRLAAHPHIHCLVTGGGLGPDGSFVHRRRFLVPLKVLLTGRPRSVAPDAPPLDAVLGSLSPRAP